MPRRAIASAGMREMSLPPNVMAPRFCSMSPARHRMNVVLPAPFAPTSATLSPRSTSMSRPCSACRSP
jgi:hypothetical protein